MRSQFPQYPACRAGEINRTGYADSNPPFLFFKHFGEKTETLIIHLAAHIISCCRLLHIWPEQIEFPLLASRAHCVCLEIKLFQAQIATKTGKIHKTCLKIPSLNVMRVNLKPHSVQIWVQHDLVRVLGVRRQLHRDRFNFYKHAAAMGTNTGLPPAI